MYGSLVTRDWKTEVPQSSVSRGDGVQTRTKNGQRQGGRGIVKIEAKYTDRPYLLSAGVPMVAQTVKYAIKFSPKSKIPFRCL